MCAGTYPATLQVTSGTAGPLYVPGTIAPVLGTSHFTGRTTTPAGYVVTAEASYDGPKCHIPTVIPVTTHVSGTYEVVSP